MKILIFILKKQRWDVLKLYLKKNTLCPPPSLPSPLPPTLSLPLFLQSSSTVSMREDKGSRIPLNEPPRHPGTSEQHPVTSARPPDSVRGAVSRGELMPSEDSRSELQPKAWGKHFTDKAERHSLAFNIDHFSNSLSPHTHTDQENQWTHKYALAVNQVILALFVLSQSLCVFIYAGLRNRRRELKSWTQKVLRCFLTNDGWGGGVKGGGEEALTRFVGRRREEGIRVSGLLSNHRRYNGSICLIP